MAEIDERDGANAFHETVRVYGVSPTWEFLMPVVVAAQRGRTLSGRASCDTAIGREHIGKPVELRLDKERGEHVTELDGHVVARGDAWEAATAFYAIVGWQAAAFEAEDALAGCADGDELLAAVREWATREEP